jgi:cytochrome P450 / NADPH-cytochrome P450 reductase
LGATQLIDRGESDAAQRDMSGDFDTWTEKLWSVLSDTRDVESKELPAIKLEWSTEQRAAHLQQDLQWAKVIDNKQLTKPGHPEKHHIAIQLPSNMTYQTGDYLAVLPLNPESSVKRVTQKFNLPWDGIVTIKDAGATILPEAQFSLSKLLRGYVELQEAVSRKVSHHSQNAADNRIFLFFPSMPMPKTEIPWVN